MSPCDRNEPVLSRRIDRRAGLKAALSIPLAVGAYNLDAKATFAQGNAKDLKEGGTLRVAIQADPTAGLDAMFTTASLTSYVSQHVFETLFALNSSFEPQAHLVEDFELTNDNQLLTMSLRKGVQFHNGKEMMSEDVVASLERWGAISTVGRLAFDRLDSIDAPDPSTVTMSFNRPTGAILDFLAVTSAFIMTAEAAEAAGDKQLPQEHWIGTGPYAFKEHVADFHLVLTRFDDYLSREEEADGKAGRRVPLLDELEIQFVPDESVRANGLMTGDYHFSDVLPYDFYDILEGDPTVVPVIVDPYQWRVTHLNKKEGLFTNQTLRHAFQLGFSQSEAMTAGFGRTEFLRFDPSISSEETNWYSIVGAEAYDNPDLEKAKALLAEGGYNGEPVRWLSNNQYAYNFLIADFVKQQLETIGMNIEITVTDWPTFSQIRADPAQWDVFITGHNQTDHPATSLFNDPRFPGFWESKEKDELASSLAAAGDETSTRKAVDAWTQVIWEEMPFVKLGDSFEFRGHSVAVKNFQSMPDWFLWNVALEE